MEFRCGGEAKRSRPPQPDRCSDRQWSDYLFYRDNPKGPLQERWVHSFGCRQWFNVIRDTSTHEIVEVTPIGKRETPARGAE